MDDLNAVIHALTEAYFVKRDYEKLFSVLSNDFSLVGTGKNELAFDGNAVKAYFARELEIYSGNFRVYDQWDHITYVTEDVALAIVGMTVESDPATGYVVQMPLRFSALLRREADGWKLAHIHNSVPYGEQGEESYFNHKVARENYHHLKAEARRMAADEVSTARLIEPLTGILNLEGFAERARAVIDTHPEKQFAILKFSIDHFRYINQSYGYSTGDEVLQDIARNLKTACGPAEVCGRIEKDNFAMLLVHHTVEETDRHMEEIRESLLSPALKKRINSVSFTAGLYLVTDRQEGIKQMLDKAMLAQQSVSHRQGLNQYRYYSSELDAAQFRRTELAEMAPAALANGEFKLYIQPQVDLQTLQPTAGEALVRWVRPDGTVIMPNDFIQLFEQNDFIIPFDFYMLDLLCANMKKWMDSGIILTPISINQSRQHLLHEDYVDRFCWIVDQYGIPHDYIAFELTESAFIENNDVMLALARKLHQKGFVLDIDDFGTGYASLNLLSLVAADVLKIDRSLLTGFDSSPRSKVVLRKVIEMAQESKMTTICEGVETAQQLAYLKELGCDMGQGYFFYRPMPVEQFEAELLHKKADLVHT